MEEVLSILRTSASVSRFPRVDSETLFQVGTKWTSPFSHAKPSTGRGLTHHQQDLPRFVTNLRAAGCYHAHNLKPAAGAICICGRLDVITHTI